MRILNHQGSAQPSVWAILALFCCVLVLIGCGPRKQVELTTFDAAAVTAQAMQQLDADADGQLNNTELKQAPGLRRSRRDIDSDRDGRISAAELQARFQSYIDQRLAILPYPIEVRLRGAPLTDATIELTPESFLEGVIEPATGKTDQYGVARPSIELDDEIARRGTTGFRSGVYRVKVSKKDGSGDELMPAKYNTDSNLGLEVNMSEHMTSLRLDL